MTKQSKRKKALLKKTLWAIRHPRRPLPVLPRVYHMTNTESRMDFPLDYYTDAYQKILRRGAAR